MVYFIFVCFFKLKHEKNYILLGQVDDGGYGREGHNCIYRGRECSFGGTPPNAGDTALVDMTNIFGNEGAFKPLLEMKVTLIKKFVTFDIQ